MPEILYSQYREYVANRIEVNNAMTALLAGSRLAAHTLQLTAGSTATLGQLFPAVEHVDRFNLRSDLARHLLRDADQHIASVAVPYALATHEEFVMAMLDFLQKEGRQLVTRGRRIKAWNMHTVLFETCGYAEPEEWLQTFHVLREVRNCIIHTGGRIGTDVTDRVAEMGAGARAGWERLNRGDGPEALNSNGRLALTAEHVLTAFAVTKRIGREVNAALGRELDRGTWARVAVEDFAASTTKTRNSSSWRRSVLGYARQYYSDAALHESDLEKASRDLGFWTLARWG
jgi:hypothetical protein